MGIIRNRNPLVQKLANTGKRLTMKSNIKSYINRLNQLNENEKRNVLTQVKGVYVNENKSNVWSEISRELGRRDTHGGKATRKSKKASKKTRKNRKH
jgi:uncharacterized protein (UPF0335 family)